MVNYWITHTMEQSFRFHLIIRYCHLCLHWNKFHMEPFHVYNLSAKSFMFTVQPRCTQHHFSSFWHGQYIHSLKRKCRFDEIFITGCTESCHNDNFQCSQWWKFHQNDNISISVFVLVIERTLVLSVELACNLICNTINIRPGLLRKGDVKVC